MVEKRIRSGAFGALLALLAALWAVPAFAANNNATVTMSHVEAQALNGTFGNTAISNVNASVTGSDILAVATASGIPSENIAVRNESSTVVLRDLDAIAVRTAANNATIAMFNKNANPLVSDANFTASNGATTTAIKNEGSSPTIESSLAVATGGTTNTGIENTVVSNPVYKDVRILPFGGAANVSVSTDGTSSARFERSELTAGLTGLPGSVTALINSLVGGAPSGGGTFVCVDAYSPFLLPLGPGCV